MKLLSLFSGIGAFEKALERLGITYTLVNYNYGLVIKTDSNNWCEMSGDTFLQLIRGDYVIRKLPWQPKKGEKYYTPSIDFDRAIRYCWDGFPSDFALKEVGMVFKTEEECEAALPALRKKYLGVE